MTAPPLSPPALSPREIAVLREWLLCDSKNEAARRLYIAPSTLSTHIARIRDKYEECGRLASTKASLLCRALQDGLIDIEDL
ncbi:LuxR C-terminal-related transcriptional regulator [Actinomycetes bacterium M1A6_2h]